MLVNLIAGNRLTLPTAVLARFEGVGHFDVLEENGCIVPTPARPGRADAVRSRLAETGIAEVDVADAVEWARQPERMRKGP